MQKNSFSLENLGSLKLTLACLLLLLVCLIVYYNWLSASWMLIFPFFLFSVNLIAAMVYQEKLRSQLPLLIFHLALLVILVFVAIGRLTYLKGWVELSEDEAFSGHLTGYESGFWHPWHLDALVFTNKGFQIQYHKGIKRGQTSNLIHWIDQAGQIQQSWVGDQIPFIMQGYRFYTSHNKGYAPTFVWISNHDKVSRVGTIHLPSYPINQFKQALTWQLPNSSQSIWTQLVIEKTILKQDEDFLFKVPEEHYVVIRINDERFELKTGEEIILKEGRLIYQSLRTWMGYKVYYDWTIPWLLATCLMAVLSLSWHYWRKFSTSWQC